MESAQRLLGRHISRLLDRPERVLVSCAAIETFGLSSTNERRYKYHSHLFIRYARESSPLSPIFYSSGKFNWIEETSSRRRLLASAFSVSLGVSLFLSLGEISRGNWTIKGSLRMCDFIGLEVRFPALARYKGIFPLRPEHYSYAVLRCPARTVLGFSSGYRNEFA